MSARVAVTRVLPTPVTTGSSFERELRTALWQRSRLAMMIGFGISVAMNVLARTVFRAPPPLAGPLAALGPNEYLVYPGIFALAAALLWKDRWSERRIEIIDIGALVLLTVVDASLTAVLYPLEDRFFTSALVLFITAAMIPWRIAFQVGLSVAVVFAYPAAAIVARELVPEVAAYWNGLGPNEIWHVAVDQTIAVGIMATVSIFITRTLYTMRRQLHAAARVGNYLIEGELGSGGMGKVYRARHALIRRPTAVKVMEADPVRRPEAVARFEREVQLSATLSHPNTITIFDFGRTEDATFYYAMELLEGVDMQRLVERHGPVPPARAVYVLRQVCGSLAEAHARSIVHRDMKPSNVFLTERGGLYDFVKVLDFGLAKQLYEPQSVQLTQVGSVFGTPLYMAPEAAAEDVVDHRADIYSVGCVAYWMLTGRPPFQGSTPFDVIARHLREEPEPPSRLAEVPMPAELESIVLRCLSKRPDDRFRDMTEMGLAVEAIPLAKPWTQAQARDWWTLHAGAVGGVPMREVVVTESVAGSSGSSR